MACPGADTCNLAVTQSRGLAADIGDALEEAGLAEVGGRPHQHLRLHQLCGQHHIADIGFFGLERRAHGRAAPGYQMLLGGHVGDMEIEFGEKAIEAAGQARAEGGRAGRRAFAGERDAGETFARLARTVRAAPRASARRSKDLDHFPTPEEAPDFYVDFDETGPYVAEVGDSECAT